MFKAIDKIRLLTGPTLKKTIGLFAENSLAIEGL